MSNMKIAFVSGKNFADKLHGGVQCSIRNYNAIMYFSPNATIDFFEIHELKSKNNEVMRIFNLIFAFLCIAKFKNMIKNILNYNFIFVDTSLLGVLIKIIKVKNPKAKIITFFHNIEYDLIGYSYENKPFRRKISKWAVFFNEAWSVKYSDILITLTHRDSGKMEKFYRKKSDAIIPISFLNRNIMFSQEKINTPLTALFLGSYFLPNIHGIEWFIENVLPFVNLRLKIIGNIHKAISFQHEKMEFCGYVENLDEYMQNADFMLFPIFIGGGMKVKTCEALMHGKNIIGTREAFEGYDIDFEKVGACCETAEEFIRAINEFPERFYYKFNEYSRNTYIEKYSDNLIFKQFARVFENCLHEDNR